MFGDLFAPSLAQKDIEIEKLKFLLTPYPSDSAGEIPPSAQ